MQEPYRYGWLAGIPRKEFPKPATRTKAGMGRDAESGVDFVKSVQILL